ncbi:BTB/POZ domain-containing protein At1g01640-like [Cotesia glomerata]|uniref:BTB/POZ domain-containing protein At1g01640-like n=1 Tax=Cotesia glomerata TaxID=32391 RepID=UPI001D0332D1|nr:BTB/POZ domain-containing protein At1g01640-like [Cotesia glomerata]
MSLEEIESTGYVKFVWQTKISDLMPKKIYSDQFRIENLENVAFTIGLEYASRTNTLTLWVKKSSLETASALIKVIVGNVEAKVETHKVVLAAHSEVFEKMLQSEMKEAKDGEINIKGFHPEIILEMLHYCYKGVTKASQDPEVALQLLEVADIYQIIELKDICESTLMNNMSTDNVLDIIDAADDHNAVDLRKTAIKFIVLHCKKVVASKITSYHDEP